MTPSAHTAGSGVDLIEPQSTAIPSTGQLLLISLVIKFEV